MKKIVKVKQCTILWNFEDLKLLHVDSYIVSIIFSGFDAEYENISKMTITRGNINEYLRMNIDYSFPGKAKFFMIDYIENILDDIPEDMRGEPEKPASHHLFDISDDATKLSWTNTDIFHHFVVHLLYLT